MQDADTSEEVRDALIRAYPPSLKDAGIGGIVRVWLLIDESGAVSVSRIAGRSGQRTLDDHALAVAPVLRFSPALDGDEEVSVWIEIPITFAPVGS